MENDEVLYQEKQFNCSQEIEKYKCGTCKFQVNLLISLKDHIRDVHRNQNSKEEVYRCLKCPFVSHSKLIMGRHRVFSECATRDEDERKNRFICSINAQLEPNVRSEDEPVMAIHKECEDIQSGPCVTQLKPQSNEKNRSLRSSSGDQYWYCEQCSYKSTNKLYFKKHVKSRHPEPEDIQWFHCPHCCYKCVRKGNLKDHVLARHSKPEDIQWIACQHCPLKFKHKGHLKRHIIYRHSKPEDIQWFACHQCPLKCKEKMTLKRHIISCHLKPEDIQWFTCNHCSSKFKRKGSLKRHTQSVHSNHEDIL